MKILHDYSQDLLAQYAKISKILGINQWLTNLTSLNMDPLYIYIDSVVVQIYCLH